MDDLERAVEAEELEVRAQAAIRLDREVCRFAEGDRAIVRRRVVTLCPSVDGLFCDTGNRWSEGWIMFANRSRTATGVRDVTEPILMQRTVDRAAKIMSNRKSYSFRSTDRRATNGTLIVCDRETRARSRALVVSYTGRPRVAYEDTRGRAYRCAD